MDLSWLRAAVQRQLRPMHVGKPALGLFPIWHAHATPAFFRISLSFYCSRRARQRAKNRPPARFNFTAAAAVYVSHKGGRFVFARAFRRQRTWKLRRPWPLQRSRGRAAEAFSAAVPVSTSKAFTTFCCFLTRETID